MSGKALDLNWNGRSKDVGIPDLKTSFYLPSKNIPELLLRFGFVYRLYYLSLRFLFRFFRRSQLRSLSCKVHGGNGHFQKCSYVRLLLLGRVACLARHDFSRYSFYFGDGNAFLV